MAAFGVFIAPLLAWLAGYLLSGAILPGAGDGARFLAGMGGFVLALGWHFLAARIRARRGEKHLPEIVRVIPVPERQGLSCDTGCGACDGGCGS